METTRNQHHQCVLEDRLTNKLSYCFLFLSGVAILSSRKIGPRVILCVCACESEIRKLQWKPRCPSNMVSLGHICLGRQLTSSTSDRFQSQWGQLSCHQEQWPQSCVRCVLFVNEVSKVARFPRFPVPMGVDFMSSGTVAPELC